jgi:hypothetical protein
MTIPFFHLERLLDGTFHELEGEEAGVIPFEIMDEEFTKVYFLVDDNTPRTADLSGESKSRLPGRKRTIHHGRKEPGKM